ncbi:uncharacterized protein V1510DRAFT_397599 [Dipodascopsis tothii]|uniref:uncharacterized protein n=1 Tax=Dipodascopsis tothii TaxID=44089 RepID=UPI0034CDD7FA
MSNDSIKDEIRRLTEQLERRANPAGWTQPRAPYNPYDPTDQRPAQGYPSEFMQPIRRELADASDEQFRYAQFREQMKRASFTPRPPSDLYPGQYKVLKKALPAAAFSRGINMVSVTLTAIIVSYAVFFYRWNEGYDNVFSDAYRYQLRLKEKYLGPLSSQEVADLRPRPRGYAVREVDLPQGPDQTFTESEWAMERPRRSHIMEAERIRQAREEQHLRGLAGAAGAADAAELSHDEWYDRLVAKDAPAPAPKLDASAGWSFNPLGIFGRGK